MTKHIYTCVVCIGIIHSLRGFKLRTNESIPRIVHHPSDVVVKVGNPATLSCRAEGNPEPAIEWLRNGLPLDPDKLEGQSRPIVLSEGSLFFLSVVPGRKGHSHEGVYACVARNSAGKATSRNASLHIAALREEFQVQPGNVEVAVGEVAVMNCSPPVGHPEPNVVWKKDGVLINRTDDHYTQLNGKLIVAPARKTDAGVYICVASNTVGVRESRAARLSVLAKPVLVHKPENVSVKVGEAAQFFCEAEGDPMPAVEWSSEQGPLPNGRYLINPDKSLQIHYVTEQDAGKYTCTAVNEVGMISYSAELFVEDASRTLTRDLHKELSVLRVELDSVAVMTTSSSMTQVRWRLQSSATQPHFLDGFEVLYRSLLPASSDWAAKKVPVPSFQTPIGPLKRGYKYEFKVRPYGRGLYGRESNTKHLRVPETVPSAPPQGITITMPADRNDTVHLSWDPPPHDAHNGIIQGYQVWCVQSDDQQFFNWTVDSGTHSLDIGMLHPGRPYWVRVAAVNGAGIGVQSDPHRLLIETKQAVSPQLGGSGAMAHILAVVREPVFIGSVGALLCCIVMVTTVCLCRHHSQPSDLKHRNRKAPGLYRLASEDLIIKHRMAAPDSPWISGAWRPAPCKDQYQGLWTQSQDILGSQKSTLPVTQKKDPGHLEAVVPIVPDSCGVYGTFYVDLSGNKLKTFNSPARCPKRPHCNAAQNCETVCIPPTVHDPEVTTDEQVLPWKRALPAQPNMGVLKESWEKNQKRELHAVNSAPLVPVHQQALVVRNASGAHHQPSGAFKQTGSPRILHYSASLHLVDMLPTPPPLPIDDTLSLSSEEGSTRSTKLTVDAGSLQSVCTASAIRGPVTISGCPSFPSPTYSRLSTASFCLSADTDIDVDTDLDLDQNTTLSTQGAAQYLELSPRADRHSTLSDAVPRPFSPTPTFGYICGPSELEDVNERQEKVKLRSTPSSCCSEWEGSLWNGWGSASGSNMASARTSLISSSDGSFMNDANFARVLAMTAESMTGGTFSDFTPPASPLSGLFPTQDCFGEVAPLPVWDWSMAWVEEMEAQYRQSQAGVGSTGGAVGGARRGATRGPVDLNSAPGRWGCLPNNRPGSQKVSSHQSPSTHISPY
ncbi:roundabout homolog 1 isoform X2 [Denticeps clupeoides]|uniref:Roundabout, axon guidance receptor, homolog 4 (Drosophila) n=1 Tax=Denticeps clupeoides TaxID=299321 RepID=A0AAY4AZV8_9TELE|nr:roundabout homolog 4 isoform X2 [Denticeps clupeoides]